MTRNNYTIEVVRSSTKGLSSMSQVSADAIATVLAKQFSSVRTSIINDSLDLEALVSRKPDLVFLGMEYVYVKSDDTSSHRIWLSDFLDEYGVAYTGSNRIALELGRNKPQAKQRVLDKGIETSNFCVINQDQTPDPSSISLNFPMFVKPANKGGGSGIDSDSVVYNFKQLRRKVRVITNSFRTDSLIEEYLPGREFSVAILRNPGLPDSQVMPIELVAPPDERGVRLLGSRVKSSNTEKALKVADVAIEQEVADLALKAFYALGARDYGRIDVRLDAAGTPQFLEANLIPSLISGYGSFPKACVLNTALDYESMIMTIAELGLARSSNEREYSLKAIVNHEAILFPN